MKCQGNVMEDDDGDALHSRRGRSQWRDSHTQCCFLHICPSAQIFSAIGFQDLTPELQNEVKELQKRMAVELEPMILEQSLTMQKILEASDHKARCLLLKYFMEAEVRRLESKKTLKGIFSAKAGALTSSSALDESNVPKEEMVTDLPAEPKFSPLSTFFDDEDAFQ
jgi:hypothetical protein